MSLQIEKWDYFELDLLAEIEVNPFIDVDFEVTFSYLHRSIRINGFYDGGNSFKARFMPDVEGIWHYKTHSNIEKLNNIEGQFECIAASSTNHGPVRVIDNFHFAYEDGTDYHPMGTTSYVWNHQGDELEALTLKTLETAPFNKMRMCVFPKRYVFNYNEPPFYPFEGAVTREWEASLLDNYHASAPPEFWDFSRFNPAYFQHLEQCILSLRDLNIEADLILFHPYDFGGWGFDRMPAEVNDRYLKYLLARISAFRNVWWSFANEYDLMLERSLSDWDHYFKLVQELDPYEHLRSIHNCRGFYDYGKSWVTHCSIQHNEILKVPDWLNEYKKPVVIDECGYEGDISRTWGSLTAQELTLRHWLGFVTGGYVGHGETYLNDEEILWWSKGGELHGESPARLAFLREIIQQVPSPGLFPLYTNSDVAKMIVDRASNGVIVGHNSEDYLIMYCGIHQSHHKDFVLPEAKSYTIDIIDTWNMSITEVASKASGAVRVNLPRLPYMAIRIQKIGT